ncbi:hypothetical protein FHW19_004597 [Ochrobactrum anthropi]|uniref:hypothetical protein n=1 Tax=Brucella anthropi TaxID=529 RepID=UPI0015FD8959|nr:hypothetical protein [Brucella anthropi]MBA8862845.1 hypothetical protein [Brucella anthropi]
MAGAVFVNWLQALFPFMRGRRSTQFHFMNKSLSCARATTEIPYLTLQSSLKLKLFLRVALFVVLSNFLPVLQSSALADDTYHECTLRIGEGVVPVSQCGMDLPAESTTTWYLQRGELPPGITDHAEKYGITYFGSPTKSGTYNAEYNTNNIFGNPKHRAFITFYVLEPAKISINPASMLAGKVGKAFSQAITASGGVAQRWLGKSAQLG